MLTSFSRHVIDITLSRYKKQLVKPVYLTILITGGYGICGTL